MDRGQTLSREEPHRAYERFVDSNPRESIKLGVEGQASASGRWTSVDGSPRIEVGTRDAGVRGTILEIFSLMARVVDFPLVDRCLDNGGCRDDERAFRDRG